MAVPDAVLLFAVCGADARIHVEQSATVAALMGIAPKDELEGMMAAQLVAAHNAAMECYRRAMIGEQTFEGRRENLNQANKLSRTYAALLEALNRHRGKGQQKVTVEHVHVHAAAERARAFVRRELRFDAAAGSLRFKIAASTYLDRKIIQETRFRA
jgi:hypothetical protein